VLIWGSTWIGIKYQLGVVDPMASVGHRFALSAVLIFLFLLLRRTPLKYPLRDHGLMLCQGLCLFCVNYYFVYHAELVLTSGLVAVVFSNIMIMNIFNGALFLGAPIKPRVLLGGILGVLGMIAVFWQELNALSLSDSNFVALLFCLAGTLSASLGNILAHPMRQRQIPVLVCNGYGMAYGAAAMYVAALLMGVEIKLEYTTAYLGSLVYLSVFGSILAFWAYITLIARMGADRAGYSNLVYPLVALMISTLLEDYTWSLGAVLGLGLVIFGNWIVMRSERSKIG
jgi:drug/metabolite transporter (DMT)-like permease